METSKKKNRRNILLIIIILLIFTVIGSTYAWLIITRTGLKTNVIKSGSLELEYENENDGIYLTGQKAEPMTEEEGLKLESYDFTLRNSGNVDMNFTIYLDDVGEYLDPVTEISTPVTSKSRIDDKFVRFVFTGDDESKLLNSIGTHPNRILETSNLKIGESKQYSLKLWIDEDATNDAMDKVFAGKIRVEAIQDNAGIGTDKDNPVPAPSD